jgi:mRNA interferase MazF
MVGERRRVVTATLRRGQIWIANLNPNRGREVGKVRPVLIVQGDWLSAAQSRTVVILPLTGDVRRDAEPLRVTVAARGGLRTESQVVVDQPRTLDRRRLGEGPLTELSDDEMARVEQSLLAVLGVIVT